MVVMEPVGEIDLTDDGDQRTWLTDNGAVLSAIAAEGARGCCGSG